MRRPVAGAVVRCAVLKKKKVLLIGEESEEGRVKLPLGDFHRSDLRFVFF